MKVFIWFAMKILKSNYSSVIKENFPYCPCCSNGQNCNFDLKIWLRIPLFHSVWLNCGKFEQDRTGKGLMVDNTWEQIWDYFWPVAAAAVIHPQNTVALLSRFPFRFSFIILNLAFCIFPLPESKNLKYTINLNLYDWWTKLGKSWKAMEKYDFF